MPKLLNSAVQLKGTTGTNSYFITLSGAQPLLGRTPNTSTGFTLVTGPDGQLGFTSTLGFVQFENGIVQSSLPNGDVTIQSTGSGRLNLNGNVYINGQSINELTANFQDLTVTNVTVLGRATFNSATSTATFLSNVELIPSVGTVTINPHNTGSINNVAIGLNAPNVGNFTQITAVLGTFTSIQSTSGYFTSITADQINVETLFVNTETVYNKLSVQGAVTLNPIDQDVNIAPSLNGTVYINPARTGYIDNMVIGATNRDAGYFTNVVTDSLTLSQELNITTASFTNLTVTYLTATNASITNLTATNLSVTGTTTLSTLTVQNSIRGKEIYDNNNRVVTNVQAVAGPGLSAIATLNGTTATVTLTNTGVISLTAGTDTVVSSTSGNIVIWNNSTLQTVTDRGSTTTNVVNITNVTSATTSTQGALTVAGGVGVGGDINVADNVYSDGGSPYYNRLLYTPAVTVSTSTPLNPRIGDFWIDPNAGVEFQYVPNGPGAIWVQFIGF